MRSGGRPNIVVVSHYCPFPTVHGNRTRFVSLLTWLRSRGFSITYVLQPLDVDDDDGLATLEKLVDTLEIVRDPYVTGGRVMVRGVRARLVGMLPARVAAALRKLVGPFRRQRASVKERWGTGDVGDDGQIDRWCWPTTCEVVHRAVDRDSPVAVITEYALLSKCLEGVPSSILRVIDTVEVFFRNRERFQVDGLAAPVVCTPESETAALARADLLVAIQKNDARVLTELFPGKDVVTVAHSYPEGRERTDLLRGTVLYVGSSNPFNVHGLQQFLAQAWQPILARVPDATLRVVGSVPFSPEADDRRVVCVGRVSDEELGREYQTAHVVINPQVAGTGLKIKCVEALSAGCPVVMNQAGADGLEEGAGSAYLVANDWGEFAAHVVRILTDGGLRRQLEREARGFAARLFSPEVTFSELEQALRRHRIVSDG